MGVRNAGKAIREARLKAGLTQDLADEIVKIRIIQLFAAVIQRIKDAWKVKNGEILHERNLRGGVLHDKRDIAVRARFEQVAVTAECGVGVNLNPHCAVA